MTYGFEKSGKLCGETTVNNLFVQGVSFMAYPMRVVWLSQPKRTIPSVKILVSVPKKKLKRAVDRNRVKRLIRESYRLNRHSLRTTIEEKELELQVAFIWIPNEKLEFDKVERKVKEALQKLEGFIIKANEPSNQP